MDATVTVDSQRILYIETVERDGSVANGRRERMLQDAYLVVVDVDIGKDILCHGIQYLASLEKIIDTRRALAFDDVLLVTRAATVDLLCHCLVNTERQYQLPCQLIGFHLFQQPRKLA